MRTFAVALFAALAFAAPAQAQLAPPPTVLDFDQLVDDPGTGIDGSFYPGVTISNVCPPDSFGSSARAAAAPASIDCADLERGFDGGQALSVFGRGLTVEFAAPQVAVSFFISGFFGGEGGTGWVRAYAGETILIQEALDENTGPFGRAVTLEGAGITSVEIGCDYEDVYFDYCPSVEIDELAYSNVAQPDTEILPLADGRLAFAGNQSTKGFECSLDDATFTPCASPLALPSVGVGTHTLRVQMIDFYGSTDKTPAAYAWTVAAPPVPQPVPAVVPPDADGDGAPDTSDNCPAAPNADQADGDRDSVGDACEVGAPGTLAPIAGERVNIEVVAGEVFVKFPSRSLKQSSPGFVPLKGQASVPVGSTVDARKGTVAMASAQNSRGTQRNARLSAGIFRIRQQRAKRGSAAVVGMDLVLQSAPGAEAACARSSRSGPIKGRSRNTVRSLTAATTKGLYRVIGGAAITTAPDATWVTRDRCDGTRTEVGRGRVSVYDREEKTTVRVPSGRSYLVKAKLFAARRAAR